MCRVTILAVLAMLGACSQQDDPRWHDDRDPITVAALADPLMIDPDLASQSQASAALGGGGPAKAEIPRESTDPRLLAAIRDEAAELAGAPLSAPPEPGAGEALVGAVTPTAFAALLPGGKACATRAGYGFVWAAALPQAFPVYPRGHAQVAAGNDLGGCRLRAVMFTSPIPPEEVAAFYLARGRSAALPLVYSRAGEELVLKAHHKGAAILLKLGRRADGLTEVWIATNGL